MKTTIKNFSNYLLYSNKNVSKVVAVIVNESSNGLYIADYDDKVILADTNTGTVYTADYTFDGKKAVFENYEQVEFEEDENSLIEAVRDYFEDDGTADTLIEGYERAAEEGDNELRNAITEALASKRTDKVNYSELVGINEELDVASMPFFEAYKERLAEKPLDEAFFFDFNKPVAVSIIDEDEDVVINRGAKIKAVDLRKDPDFKEAFLEAADDYLNGDSSSLATLIEDNVSILSLSDAELKELVGLTVVGSKELMENRKEIISGINEIISENEELLEKAQLLKEEEDASDDDAEKSDAPETTDKDLEALSKALDEALSKISNEGLAKKIQDLKDAIDEDKKNGTVDVKTVKECVELLSM